MCCTSQVQIWQGSSAGWKLSPGPYTLPSNTQSTHKQPDKINEHRESLEKKSCYDKMLQIFAHRHTQGSTLRARWWSWCRETDSVPQSTWSLRPHTCRSYRGWSLQTSCCPRHAPLLHTHNLRGKIHYLVKKLFPPLIIVFADPFTSTARTAGSRISHLMHARQLGTLRGRTVHLTCLQDSQRLTLKLKQRCTYGGKRENRPCKCR